MSPPLDVPLLTATPGPLGFRKKWSWLGNQVTPILIMSLNCAGLGFPFCKMESGT